MPPGGNDDRDDLLVDERSVGNFRADGCGIRDLRADGCGVRDLRADERGVVYHRVDDRAYAPWGREMIVTAFLQKNVV